MKTDHRVQYTQKVITDCFFDLLKQMPVSRISVKAICEAAGINRSTFYRHYLDVYDLLEKTENIYLDELVLYSKEYTSMEEALRIMLEQARRTESRFFLLLPPTGSARFLDRIYETAYQRYKDGFARRHPHLPEERRRWLFLFITTGTIAIVQEWLKSGKTASVDDVISLIAALDEQILSARL